jgi:hypothetical protein
MPKGLSMRWIWISLLFAALSLTGCDSRRTANANAAGTPDIQLPLTPCVFDLPAGVTMHEFLDRRFLARQREAGIDLLALPVGDLQAQQVAFGDILNHISETAGVPIDVRWGELGAIGINQDVSIARVSFDGCTVGEAIQAILGDLHSRGPVAFRQNARGAIEISTADDLTSRPDDDEPRTAFDWDSSTFEWGRRLADYRATRNVLATPCGEFAFWDTNFQMALEKICESTQMDVLVLWGELEAVGVTPETPVNMALYDVTLDEGLTVLLDNLGASVNLIHVVGIHQTIVILPATTAAAEPSGALIFDFE